jgi:hypothetical protein
MRSGRTFSPCRCTAAASSTTWCATSSARVANVGIGVLRPGDMDFAQILASSDRTRGERHGPRARVVSLAGGLLTTGGFSVFSGTMPLPSDRKLRRLPACPHENFIVKYILGLYRSSLIYFSVQCGDRCRLDDHQARRARQGEADRLQEATRVIFLRSKQRCVVISLR